MSLDTFGCVATHLRKIGWKVLDKPKIEDNYFDLTAISHRKSLRVEIKQLQQKPNGAWQCGAVSDNQLRCDAVAIVFPDGNVFIEKTEDYMRHVSDKGYRQFTWLKP